MDPQALPLKDIHMPPAASWWPLAPLTWVLIGVVLVVACSIVWQLTRHGRQTRYRWMAAWYARRRRSDWRRAVRQRLQTLRSAYAQNGNDQALLSGLSMLLRRALITEVGRQRAAAPIGDDWLQLLDGDDPSRPFSTGIGRVFEYGPYQASVTSAGSGVALLRLCERRLLGEPRQ
ncbi:MAG: DUF4381 domain-containing protein [Pseudomonadota bacterium]